MHTSILLSGGFVARLAFLFALSLPPSTIWAQQAATVAGEEFFITNFRSGPVCREDPVLVEQRKKDGHPPSDRICEGRKVYVEGLDTCIYDRKMESCTWYGFEFDFYNADPGIPLACEWRMSIPINDGSPEGILASGVSSGNWERPMDGSEGHVFVPLYHVAGDVDTPWFVVKNVYECSYDGRPLFEADYQLIFSSTFN